MTSKHVLSNMSEQSNQQESERKRKIEEVEKDTDEDSSSDEDDLFIPQAREVLAQAKKSNKISISEITDKLSSEEDDDSDQWETEEEPNDDNIDEDEEEEDLDAAEVEPEEEEDQPPGESLEELAAGREEKEEDAVVKAISEAAKPPEKTKPPDLRSSSMVTDISFHPNRDLIAMCNIEGEITCYKYDNEENELLHTLNHHKKSCRVLTFDKEGDVLFSASKDKSVVLTDVETMTVKQTYKKAHNSPIYSMLCMGPHIFATGDDDGLVKVWDTRHSSQKPIYEVKEMDEFVSSMITDSNSRLLLCTSGEGTLTAFNTRARKMDGQSEVYPSEMNCAGLIRQESKVLAGLGNGNMYIFDWKAFGYHSDAFGDHPSAVNCLLPITENIVITGCDDGKIRAVHLFPHRFLGVVGHHRFPVERLDISTCGRYIASSSHDNRVRFWNISFFDEDPEAAGTSGTLARPKKSVRNKKRSTRKERMGFQLPSSKRKNKSDFFAGLAEPEPEPQEEEAAAEDDSDDSDDSD